VPITFAQRAFPVEGSRAAANSAPVAPNGETVWFVPSVNPMVKLPSSLPPRATCVPFAAKVARPYGNADDEYESAQADAPLVPESLTKNWSSPLPVRVVPSMTTLVLWKMPLT
jgi:hypothetical protein